MELLLILLIVLILWPKPVFSAAKWAIRHAFGRPAAPEAPATERGKSTNPPEP